MKKQFEAVVALKNASGFTYSDDDGAGITLAQADVWNRYVKVWIKSHGHAKPPKNKGFIHFQLLEMLTPTRAKGAL
ncbi:hypothetical protein PAXRUDRAFT_109524, partial [Paxillus rubicundulus Ve08.2h10]